MEFDLEKVKEGDEVFYYSAHRSNTEIPQVLKVERMLKKHIVVNEKKFDAYGTLAGSRNSGVYRHDRVGSYSLEAHNKYIDGHNSELCKHIARQMLGILEGHTSFSTGPYMLPDVAVLYDNIRLASSVGSFFYHLRSLVDYGKVYSDKGGLPDIQYSGLIEKIKE